MNHKWLVSLVLGCALLVGTAALFQAGSKTRAATPRVAPESPPASEAASPRVPARAAVEAPAVAATPSADRQPEAALQPQAEPGPEAERPASEDPSAVYQAVASAVDPEQAHRVKLEKMRRRAAYYDQIIGQERPDTDWSSEVADQLSSALGMLPDGAIEVTHATCSTTLCRVGLAYSDLESGDRLLRMSKAARTLLGVPAMLLPAGSGQLKLYMPRRGQELPELTSERSEAFGEGA